MRSAALGLLVVLALTVPIAAQAPPADRSGVVDLKQAPPSLAISLEGLWADYRRFAGAGDKEGAGRQHV